MKKSRTSKEYGTDLERLDAMKDEDIDFSDIPEVTAEMFARGVVVPPLKDREPREDLTVRLDRDLAVWYRDMGPGQNRMINFALRRFMQEELRRKRRTGTRRAS
jgi:uncharacterized protein (DUF4415 family)